MLETNVIWLNEAGLIASFQPRAGWAPRLIPSNSQALKFFDELMSLGYRFI